MGTSCRAELGYPRESSLEMPPPASPSMAKTKLLLQNGPADGKGILQATLPLTRVGAPLAGYQELLAPLGITSPSCLCSFGQQDPPDPAAGAQGPCAGAFRANPPFWTPRTSLQHCSSEMFLPLPAWGWLLLFKQQQPHKLLPVLPFQGGL